MGDTIAVIDDRAADLLEQLYAAVMGMRGDGSQGVTVTHGGIVIRGRQQATDSPETGQVLIGLAQITAAGADASHWAWKFALRNSSTGLWEASTFGSESSGECVIAEAAPGRIGMNGLLYMQLGSDSVSVFTLVPINTRGLIAVSLTADGGSDGSASTTPSYTYKWPVDLMTGDEIKKADTSRATGMAPTWSRSKGSYNQAAYGTVYINSSGNPVLFQCDETEKTCT